MIYVRLILGMVSVIAGVGALYFIYEAIYSKGRNEEVTRQVLSVTVAAQNDRKRHVKIETEIMVLSDDELDRRLSKWMRDAKAD